jgi:hypothetical protein
MAAVGLPPMKLRRVLRADAGREPEGKTEILKAESGNWERCYGVPSPRSLQ